MKIKAGLKRLSILTVFLSFNLCAWCQCTISVPAVAAFCNNQPNAVVTATGTGLTLISWSSIPTGAILAGGSTTTPTINTSSVGTYVLIVNGNTGECLDTITVTINANPATPNFTVNPNTPQCSGTLINFSVNNPLNGISYSWNFGDGGSASGANASHSFSATGNGNTPFSTSLTASNSFGCTSSNSSTVQVKRRPENLLIDLNNQPEFVSCNGGSFALSVADISTDVYTNYSINWGDGSAVYTSPSPPPLSPGVSHTYTTLGYNTITYTITNSNNCTTTKTYTTFNGGNPQVGLANPGGTTGLCTPSTLSFPISNVANNAPGTIYIVTTNDGSAPDTFSHPPPASYVHQFLNTSCGTASPGYPNSFYVRIEAVNPCASSSATVEPITTNSVPDADFTISPDTIACVNSTLTFTNKANGGAWVNAQNQCDTTKIVNWAITPNTGFTVTSGSLGNNPPLVNATSTWGSNAIGVQFNTPGIYLVKMWVRTKNICGYDSIIKTVCIQTPPSPSFTATPSLGCSPMVVNFTNTSTGTSQCGPITRLWTVVQTSNTCLQDSLTPFRFISSTNAASINPVIRFNNAGTYTVKLTLTNACGPFTTAVQTFTVKRKPEATLSGVPAFQCSGLTISPGATALPCLGTITQYAWSFPGGNPNSSSNQSPGTITYATAGTYNVSVAVSNECGTTNAANSITIQNAPLATAGANQSYCSGGSIQIGGPATTGYTYSWSPSTGLSSTTVSNPTVTLTNNGTSVITQTYTVVVTNQANCTASATTTVSVHPQPTITVGPSVTICNVNTTNLLATLGGSATGVIWSSNNGGSFSNANSLNPVYTPSVNAGTVILTATSTGPTSPCQVASDTMVVTVVQPPNANAGADQQICSGSSVGVGSAQQTGYLYSWSPSAGLSNAASANPSVSLSNTGNTVSNQTYTLIVSATGCSDTDQVLVAVYPPAVVNAGNGGDICYGDSIQLSGTISGAATSANWSSSHGTFTNANALNTFFRPNIQSGIATIALTSNDPLGPCPAAVATLVINVNAIPVISTIANQTVCEGTPSSVVNFNSSVSGTTYSWTAVATVGVNGFPVSGSSSSIPSFTPTNSNNTSGTITYTVIPTANACVGLPVSFSFTVNPAPTLSPIAPQNICSGQSTTLVVPNADISGSVFSWTSTVAGNATGNILTGNGNIPAQALTNTGISNATVTYSVIASSNNCPSAFSNLVVTVYPVPTVNNITAQSICSGGQTTAVIPVSTIPNATFAWSAASSNTTGFTVSGTGNIPVQTLTYTGITQGTVTYTITPSANGCPGIAQNFTVTVNPTPTVNVTLVDDTICSVTATNISLSAPISGMTYAWTVNAPPSISGALSGSGNTIQQTLTNNSSILQQVIYNITPSANNCPGIPVTAIVYVYPGITVNLSPIHQSICSGNHSAIVNITSPTNGVSFTWTSQANGVTGVVPSGTNTIPIQTLTNNTNAPIDVIYAITSDYAGCITQTANDTITVNPIPAVSNNPLSQTICAGQPTQVISLTSTVSGTTYTWIGSSNSGITGFIPNGSSQTIPSHTLSNTNTASGTVQYIITPTANNCPGLPSTYIITVNPIPNIVLPTQQTICSGDTSVEVAITSNVAGTTFSWLSTATSGVSGNTTTGTGNIPAQILTNSNSSIGNVTYAITASANNCLATSNYIINVSPSPSVVFSLPVQTICSGTPSSAVNLTSSTAGANISWSAIVPAGISGATVAGTTIIPSETLTNTTFQPLTITYTAQAVTAGITCPGAISNYTITVNPLPDLSISPAVDTICSATQTSIQLTSSVPGTVFNWTVNAPNSISGQGSGTGSSIAQTLSSSDANPQSVVYSITTIAANCPGQTGNSTIIVYPSPTVQFSLPDQIICSGFSTQAVQLSSSTAGAVITWSSIAPISVSGSVANGTISIPTQTLINSSNTPQQVIYTASVNFSACPGVANSYLVTVNPTPHIINSDTLQTVCSGDMSASVALLADVANSTYTWNGSGGVNLSGYQSSGNSNTIPSQAINNNSNLSDTVLYTVSPLANGCVGPNQQFRIAVNPRPIITITPDTQVICTNVTSQPISISSNIPSTTFAWSSISNLVSGAISNGIGNTIPSQSLLNTSPIADTGSVIFTVIPTAAGCPGQGANAFIQVNPSPVVNFAMSTNTGCSPLHVSFATNTLTFGNPDSLVFNWGDGSVVTVLHPNPIQPVWSTIFHTFTNSTFNPVTYTISLTTNNECGDTTVFQTVTVQPNTINAFFTPSVISGCEPLSVSFADFSTGATYTSWCFDYDLGNDTCSGSASIVPAGTTVQHTYSAGTYSVALYITDGCSQDTAYQTIVVSPSPVVDFSFNNNVCENSPVTFTQQATAPAGVFLTAYDWQFGDGDSATNSSVTHNYDSAMIYTVCLKVSSSNGCANTACKNVTIASTPIADFTGYNTCVNTQPLQFVNNSIGATFYQWDFGDGNTSVLSNPGNNYAASGTYTVTLISSTNGCSDTISHNYVIYPKPNAAFTLPVTYVCGTPASVSISNNSSGALGYAWDFGNNTFSSAVNPVSTFTTTGLFNISLVAANQFNCYDTANNTINIHPYPVIHSIDIQPADGCQPLQITATVDATNGNTYIWDFGDGASPVSLTGPTANYTYPDTGTYTIKVWVYSTLDCGDTAVLSDTIQVHINPVANFNFEINTTIEPIDGTVIFTNQSEHAENYLWNFGDGFSSVEEHPSHHYENVDSFAVTLTAYNHFGCEDAITKSFYIFKRSLWVPNALQPEYVGPNDLVRVWQPIGIGIDAKNYKAQVYNTWGELLWESTKIVDTKPAEGWDGTYKGVICPQDVYVWKIYAKFLDNKEWPGMDYGKGAKTIGDITLIR